MDVKDIKIPVKNKEKLSKLVKYIKKFPLDNGLRPLINLLPKILEYEKS